MLNVVVLGPNNPCQHPWLLHPVPECPNVLLLLWNHYVFQGEEDLINIQVKDILVKELSESMSAMLRYATYLICKGNA